MTNENLIDELFNDLMTYDSVTLENIFKEIRKESFNETILNRFTFESDGDLILISDDVNFNESGSWQMNKDQFLLMLKNFIKK